VLTQYGCLVFTAILGVSLRLTPRMARYSYSRYQITTVTMTLPLLSVALVGCAACT